MNLEYCTLDVFTDRHFGGNPLAVVLDARGLEERTMQSIAREFNYSETSFVLPPANPAHTAHVRIFTPGGELPFAGHPTVGTAFALATLDRIGRHADDITFEEGIGPVSVSIDRDNEGSIRRCTLTTAQPPELIETLEDRRAVAAMLGLAQQQVQATPEVWSCGVPFLVVPLVDVDALGKARLDLAQWSTLLRNRSTQKVYPIAQSGDATWRVRMFAPGIGVAEDPATGAAAAALAGWLARYAGSDGRQTWEILQGQEIGRPSTIALDYQMAGNAACRVRVGGCAVVVARGSLTL
jgi:trans-2,3-dihydro-3-hydroxyanthranilate isomerase